MGVLFHDHKKIKATSGDNYISLFSEYKVKNTDKSKYFNTLF